jgi:hypothetical protein
MIDVARCWLTLSSLSCSIQRATRLIGEMPARAGAAATAGASGAISSVLVLPSALPDGSESRHLWNMFSACRQTHAMPWPSACSL